MGPRYGTPHRPGRGSELTRAKETATFGDPIDLHLATLQEVGRSPRRSKAFTLDALKEKLGKVRMADLNRERLIRFGKEAKKHRVTSTSSLLKFSLRISFARF